MRGRVLTEAAEHSATFAVSAVLAERDHLRASEIIDACEILIGQQRLATILYAMMKRQHVHQSKRGGCKVYSLTTMGRTVHDIAIRARSKLIQPKAKTVEQIRAQALAGAAGETAPFPRNYLRILAEHAMQSPNAIKGELRDAALLAMEQAA